MARKKKQEEEEQEETQQEEQEEEFDYNEDADVPQMDDSPVDSLGLAKQISKESETAKNFKELPNEVKYSFYDINEKQDVKHFSRTYRNHKYIEKIIDLRVKEDERLKKVRKKVVNIKNNADLKEYFKASNRAYLINDLKDISIKDKIKLYEHVKKLKHNYLLDTIEDNKEQIKDLYLEYNKLHDTPSYIDDMGNIGKIIDTSITSMGFKGNAAQHSVMTINAVKNEDIQKTAEKSRSFGFMDAIKNKLG